MEQIEMTKDLYKVTRAQTEHIDNILSQRVVWLVISQSFFFSGYAILTTGNPPDPAMIGKQHQLLILFPIASIVLILFSLFDIISGSLYLKKLRLNYRKYKQSQQNETIYPPLEGFKMLNRFKNVSLIVLPIIFLIVWIYILCT